MTLNYRHRNKMQTGDILLFSGKGALSSVIKRFTRSGWSHVGMVVREPSMDIVMCLESTTLSNVRDAETGEYRSGVQLVVLSERMRNYDGEVAWRKLHHQEGVASLHGRLRKFRDEVRGRPYEESNIELIRSAFGDGWLGNKEEAVNSLFCSELVAEAYQAMGFFREPPMGPASNSFDPVDFSEAGGREGMPDKANVLLAQSGTGARLGQAITIWLDGRGVE